MGLGRAGAFEEKQVLRGVQDDNGGGVRAGCLADQRGIKSGTNTLHGSAFEYFRNTVLDATTE
ncbi:MAG: hypothetical protein M3O02_03800 [Acidobacteriota bacterium]|nr:hypothetical protein [Acidobacteriota bacterium]